MPAGTALVMVEVTGPPLKPLLAVTVVTKVDVGAAVGAEAVAGTIVLPRTVRVEGDAVEEDLVVALV